MNIVLSTDNNYVQHCGVVMESILSHNNDVIFYLLTDDSLTEKNAALLNEVVLSHKASLHILKVPNATIDNCPMPKGMSSHISKATYYRLLLTDLLPPGVEKVIYLDCDIIVRKSLLSLWETNLDHKALAAVYQYNEWADANNTWSRLNIPREYGYFNAGVLLINLKYWRTNNIQQKLFNYISSNYDSIRSHDQDTLNGVLSREVKNLPITWNLMSWIYDDCSKWTFPYPEDIKYIDQSKRNPSIVHFVSIPKPWEFACTHKFKHEYYRYLEMTPWRGYKPPFILKDYLTHKVRKQASILIHSLLKRLGLR